MKYTIEQLKKMLAEAENAEKLQLEDHNMVPQSTDDWVLTKYVDGLPVAWEVVMEDESKEYIYTGKEAMAEAKRQGKRLPTNEELTKILKTKEDLKNIVYSGYRDTDGSFYGRGTDLLLWSSTESSTSAFNRCLISSYSTVNRSTYDELYGFSVRCIKN